MTIRYYQKVTNTDLFLDPISDQIDPTDTIVEYLEASNSVHSIEYTDVSGNAAADLDEAMEARGYVSLGTQTSFISGRTDWGSFLTANEPTSLSVVGDTGYDVDKASDVLFDGTNWISTDTPWERTGTILTPLTSGDEVNIPTTSILSIGPDTDQANAGITLDHTAGNSFILNDVGDFNIENISGGDTTLSSDGDIILQAPTGNITQQIGSSDDSTSLNIINSLSATILSAGGDKKVGVGISSPLSSLEIFETNAVTGSSGGVTITQASTGDALLHYRITGGQRYSMGIDNSEADAFKIAASASLASSTLLTVESTGEVTVHDELTVVNGINLPDSSPISLGDATDLIIQHDGTDSELISSTGNLSLTNINATGETIAKLGSDDINTAFEVQNNSGDSLFRVDGSGDITGDVTDTGAEPFGGYGGLANYIQYSEDLTNAVWTDFPAVAVITDTATAPNSEPTADEVTFSGNGLAFRQTSLGAAATTVYTVSVWSQLVSGDATWSVDIGDGTGGGVQTSTSEWTRHKILVTSGASNDWLDLNKQGGAGVINFWGFQVVLGDNDYPYMKTESFDVQTAGVGSVVNETLYVTSAFDINHNGTITNLTNNVGDLQINNIDGDIILDNATATGKIIAALGTNTSATAFEVQKSNGDPVLAATGNGLVGIGTDLPASDLHILENSGQIGANAGITMEQVGLGDATFHYLAGGTTFSTGIDQSDSNKFKISMGADLVTNNRLAIDTSGLVGIGTDTPVSILHTFENNAFTDARAGINIQQSGAGDAVLHFELPAQAWSIGANNSTADAFAISSSSDLGINEHFGISATTGAVGIGGDLAVATGVFFVDASATRVSVGINAPTGRFHVYEDTTETGAAAGVTIENDGTGDAVLHYYIPGAQYWSVGIDNSNVDSYKISAGSALGTNDYMSITPAGNTQFNLGGNDNSAIFAIHNANGDPLFHLDGNATVGFGTDSPLADIHVYQNSSSTGFTAGILVEQEGTGDAQIAFSQTIGNVFAIGMDQSDNEAFKICASGLLGSNDRFTIDGVSTLINLSTDSAGSDFQVQGLSGGTVIEALGSGDVGINGAAIEAQPLTVNTATGDDVVLSTLKEVVITDSNFGNANTTDLYFNRGGAGFNQSEFYMYNQNNNVDTSRYFRMNFSNNGDTDQNGLQINYDGSVAIPSLITSSVLGTRAAFAVDTTTQALGIAAIYACTDTTVTRTLTISTFTIALGSSTEVHQFSIKDESGGAGGSTNIVIETEGAQTIDGETSIEITADYGEITLYSDGSNLFVLGD